MPFAVIIDQVLIEEAANVSVNAISGPNDKCVKIFKQGPPLFVRVRGTVINQDNIKKFNRNGWVIADLWRDA